MALSFLYLAFTRILWVPTVSSGTIDQGFCIFSCADNNM